MLTGEKRRLINGAETNEPARTERRVRAISGGKTIPGASPQRTEKMAPKGCSEKKVPP